MNQKRVAILGSTGSIGRQSLEVISETPGLKAVALGARTNWQLLAEQLGRYRPDAFALTDAYACQQVGATEGVEVFGGPDAMKDMVLHTKPDVVVSAVVGSAGLTGTLAAIEVGATLALANKESLVCAGAIVMPAARAAGTDVLPVDSEHSGIFQCIMAGRHEEIRRVIITSSGGALRDWSDTDAHAATAEQALNHPTWEMGPKITIDSATLMNKVLEVIEAHWLFDLPAEKIEVVIHPQSVVHALVEFCDGSVIAQLAQPDMKLPIAYALDWPHRPQRDVPLLDLPKIGNLEFRSLEGRNARAVELAYQVIRRGGACGAVLNAANETAVEAFLAGRIHFGDIVDFVEATLGQWIEHESALKKPPNYAESSGTLESLMAADRWARRHVSENLPGGMNKTN